MSRAVPRVMPRNELYWSRTSSSFYFAIHWCRRITFIQTQRYLRNHFWHNSFLIFHTTKRTFFPKLILTYEIKNILNAFNLFLFDFSWFSDLLSDSSIQCLSNLFKVLKGTINSYLTIIYLIIEKLKMVVQSGDAKTTNQLTENVLQKL